VANVLREGCLSQNSWFGQNGVCYTFGRRKPNQFGLVFLAGLGSRTTTLSATLELDSLVLP